MKKPILLLTFNRPSQTKQVFEEIKKYQPDKLYVSSDGPRVNNKTDLQKVSNVREIFENKECIFEIKTKWNQNNKGCRQSVSEAITWFFQNEPDGIILEDDCLPDPTFFLFCEQLLEKYKNNSSVFCLTGSSFLNEKISIKNSYWFSQMNYSWGWASWARAWENYLETEKNIQALVSNNQHKNLTRNKTANRFLAEIIEKTANKTTDSWANIWAFAQLIEKGYCAVPSHNLITNLGLGKDATHTTDAYSGYTNKVIPLLPPIKHPEKIEHNFIADEITFKRFFRFLSDSEKFIQKLKRIPTFPLRWLKRKLK